MIHLNHSRLSASRLAANTQPGGESAINPDAWPGRYLATDPNAGVEETKSECRREWEAEEAQCREPLRYPTVKWDHQAEFGKTFAIIKFRERDAGDRKKELDAYTKAIGARFYKQWSRVGSVARIGLRLFLQMKQTVRVLIRVYVKRREASEIGSRTPSSGL